MDAKQVAEEFMAAFNANEMEKCRSMLSDGFTFSGPVPEPMNADGWMGIVMGMRAAFSDLNYNLKITGGDGMKVMTSTQLSGTHDGDWDMTKMGMGMIPATGKKISNPVEEGIMTIENGKIASYFISAKEDSGIAGMMKQLGIQMPA